MWFNLFDVIKWCHLAANYCIIQLFTHSCIIILPMVYLHCLFLDWLSVLTYDNLWLPILLQPSSILMQQLKEEAYHYDFDGHPTDYEVWSSLPELSLLHVCHYLWCLFWVLISDHGIIVFEQLCFKPEWYPLHVFSYC
jgi:hypothetical protein